jgi:hypothetical protein
MRLTEIDDFDSFERYHISLIAALFAFDLKYGDYSEIKLGWWLGSFPAITFYVSFRKLDLIFKKSSKKLLS